VVFVLEAVAQVTPNKSRKSQMGGMTSGEAALATPQKLGWDRVEK
jgi:hypothetical protein